jgi:hypothetical protein
MKRKMIVGPMAKAHPEGEVPRMHPVLLGSLLAHPQLKEFLQAVPGEVPIFIFFL